MAGYRIASPQPQVTKRSTRLAPSPREHWTGADDKYKRGSGPGSTASGHPTSAPPEVRPPPSNIVFL